MSSRSDYTRVSRPTPAELRALQACAHGARGFAGAAQVLGIAPTTVATHIKRARAKLQAASTSHAVYIALRGGLIT